MTADLRCEVTGNECGTDTWKRGHTCPCKACQAFLLEPMTDAEIGYLLQVRALGPRRDNRCDVCRIGRWVLIDHPSEPWAVMRGEFSRQLDAGRDVWPTHCTGCGAIGMTMFLPYEERRILDLSTNRDGHT